LVLKHLAVSGSIVQFFDLSVDDLTLMVVT